MTRYRSDGGEGNQAKGPLPIVLGATGHRDLCEQDIPILEENVRNIFISLQKEYPHTPIHLLSPLAEGADRLMANVALEAGCSVTVPLPMRQDLYEKDFETEESLREFHALLQRCQKVFELPLASHLTEADIVEHGAGRDFQYGLLGAYIVRNSHALIALWDGLLPERSNGTADVVGFNLNGIPREFAPSRSLLEPIESDPVWHIVTPRRSNTKTVGTPLETKILYPDRYETREEAERSFRSVLRSTNEFNRDSLIYTDDLEEERAKSRNYLLPGERKELQEPGLAATRDLFATADSIADMFGRRTHSTLKTLFLTVTAAAIIFDIYTHIIITLWPLLATYLMLLTLTYIVVIRSQRKTYQSRYLDYRALAEGLRVRFFWRLSGIGDEIADHYLHKQRSQLDWIRYALRVWNAGEKDDSLQNGGIERGRERIALVLKEWVEDQLNYFRKAAKREEKAVHRAERQAGIMIIIGILLALFQVIEQGIIDPAPAKQPIHWLLVAVALAPILAGLLLGYIEKRAHGDHAKEYERMSIIFANGRDHLARLLSEENLPEAQKLISDLGREALAENGDWVLIHRDRPIEVPKA